MTKILLDVTGAPLALSIVPSYRHCFHTLIMSVATILKMLNVHTVNC